MHCANHQHYSLAVCERECDVFSVYKYVYAEVGCEIVITQKHKPMPELKAHTRL